MPEMSASVSSSILVVENPSPTFSSFYSICCCCFGGFKLDRLFELLGRVTAIDRKNLSGSERCAGGTEPDHDAGDLFRLADPADGNRAFQHLLYFRRRATKSRYIRVSIAPGATALTRTFCLAYSSATDLVSPLTACLLAT